MGTVTLKSTLISIASGQEYLARHITGSHMLEKGADAELTQHRLYSMKICDNIIQSGDRPFQLIETTKNGKKC